MLAQERINLSGTWQFAFAANQKEADRLERFYTSDFAKSKFKSTPVPSNWALLGYEEPVYRGFKDNQAGEGFLCEGVYNSSGLERQTYLVAFRWCMVIG